MKENLILSMEQFAIAKEYWLNHFTGEISLLKLQADFSATPGYEKGETELVFSTSLAHKMIQLSKNQDLALYVLTLTGLNILFAKYTNLHELMIISPVYTKADERWNRWVIVKQHIDLHLTFKDTLLALRDEVVAVYQHQHYPVEKILNELGWTESDVSPVIFLAEKLHNLQDVESLIQSGANDLLLILETEKDLRVKVQYNTCLYTEKTIQTLLKSLHYILEQAMVDNNILLSQIELINQVDREHLLYTVNQTSAEYPKEKLLNQLFEEQVEKCLDSIAAIYEGQSLTYRELNQKANQLAKTLRQKGVGVQSVVALMVERSLDMVIGIWAILKAGSSYLPIDPDYPAERINYMLIDGNARFLLTQEKFRGKASFSGEILCFEDETIYVGEDSNLALMNNSLHLANIIYTSGSTGQPKGVMIRHQSLVNYTYWRIKSYGLQSTDVTLQLISLSFDGFGSNFYSSFLAGGVLVIPSEEQWRDVKYLTAGIKAWQITNMSIVPSIYRALLQHAEKDDLHSLRLVILAAEKTDSELIELSQKRIPGALLVNEYGPTENTITSTAHIGLSSDNTAIIGRPIANHRVYIFNDNQTLLPEGVAGEICVSGDGLAEGYVNQLTLTSEKFLPNPYIPGEKIYRTGDRGRWLSDGTLEILGRLDSQLKIRGHRIEVEEIEQWLMEHPSVHDAAVVGKNDPNGSQYLVAYLVTAENSPFEVYRELLSQRLPEYMIPTQYHRIEKMPLTVNGKKDRKFLQTLDDIFDRDYLHPRNEIERTIAAIWSELLGIDEIGIDQNFYMLGGHSLTLISLLSRIYDIFGVELPLKEVVKKPTVREIAEYLQANSAGEVEDSMMNEMILLNSPQEKNLFAFPPLASYGIVYEGLAKSLTDYSFYSFNFIESVNPVEEYIKLITEVQQEGPYILLGYSAGGNLAYEVAKGLVESGYQVSDLLILDSGRLEVCSCLTNEEIVEEVREMMSQKTGTTFDQYLENPFIKERVAKKIQSYLTYLNGLENTGTIDMDITVIKSLDMPMSGKVDSRELWKTATCKNFSFISGFGTHSEMLNPPALEKNVQIIIENLEKEGRINEAKIS